MLAIGSAIPDVCACDDRGTLVKLADLAGTPFVLWFYPRASTPG